MMTDEAKNILCVLVGLLIFLFSDNVFSQAVIEVGKFSAERVGDKVPSDWKPLAFKKIEKHTTYALVKSGTAFYGDTLFKKSRNS